MAQELSFEEYYEQVQAKLRGLGYTQVPDEGTVKEDYEAGTSVELSAESFDEDWSSGDDEDSDDEDSDYEDEDEEDSDEWDEDEDEDDDWD